MAQRAEQTLDGTAREEAVPGRAESAVLAQHCSCCLLLLFTVLSSSPKPRGQREGSFTRRERDGLSCDLEAPVASKSLPVGPTSSCGLALAGSGSSTPGPLEGSSWSEDVNGLCWREREPPAFPGATFPTESGLVHRARFSKLSQHSPVCEGSDKNLCFSVLLKPLQILLYSQGHMLQRGEGFAVIPDLPSLSPCVEICAQGRGMGRFEPEDEHASMCLREWVEDY